MKCAIEHYIYAIRSNKNYLIILYLNVDDLLVSSSCKKQIGNFKVNLMKKFEMTGLGNILYFLGIKFYKYGRGLKMHERRYVSKILKKIEMEHYNSTSSPAEQRLQFTRFR